MLCKKKQFVCSTFQSSTYRKATKKLVTKHSGLKVAKKYFHYKSIKTKAKYIYIYIYNIKLVETEELNLIMPSILNKQESKILIFNFPSLLVSVKLKYLPEKSSNYR